MINADFCTGSVLISFGAVLGKTSPIQLLTMAMFEVTLFAVNEFILLSLLGVRLSKAPITTWESLTRAFLWWIMADLLVQTKDAGGSMTIHTFGAYFGLMVTRILYRPNLDKSKHKNSSVYHSDLFAMIGESSCWSCDLPSAPRLPQINHCSLLVKLIWPGLLWSQVPSTCGCSGPASTRPSRLTETTSTARPWTPTTPWQPARWPHTGCRHSRHMTANWTWWGDQINS